MSRSIPYTNHRNASSRPAGFFLLEMMICLALMGVGALIAMQVFHLTLRVWRETEKQQANESAIDSAVRQLREDVWGASSIEQHSDHHITIETANGTIVHWTWSAADSTLVRLPNGEAEPRRWSRFPGTLTFAVRGPTVVLRLQPDPHGFANELVLPSQTMLLEGKAK
jgi:prepilin-type N-terminal cleavage/methylation domain-containing protein